MKSISRFLAVGSRSRYSSALFTLVALLGSSQATAAQVPVRGAPLPVMPPPPATPQQSSYDASEIDRIVSPIALYPDPLLAQVLTAATFSSQIPFALQWVDERRGMSGAQLADALAAEQVSWDPSVQALVAFPTVLQMMASSMPWTTEIGEAFMGQHADVMDAVQRLRAQAQRYGYLQSTPNLRVTRAPVIEIVPVEPEYIVVPYYDPVVVFAPPRPRFILTTAIYFGYGVRLGFWDDPWGWGYSGFYWPAHRVIGAYPGWGRGYREPFRPAWYTTPRVLATPHGYTDPRQRWPGEGHDRPSVHPSAPPGTLRTAQPRPSLEMHRGPSHGMPRLEEPRSEPQRVAAPRSEPQRVETPRSAGPRPTPRSGGDGGTHGDRAAMARPR